MARWLIRRVSELCFKHDETRQVDAIDLVGVAAWSPKAGRCREARAPQNELARRVKTQAEAKLVWAVQLTAPYEEGSSV